MPSTEPFFCVYYAPSYLYFCRNCSTTTIIDQLTAVILFCHTCQGDLIQQSDIFSSFSSINSSRPLNLQAPPFILNFLLRRTVITDTRHSNVGVLMIIAYMVYHYLIFLVVCIQLYTHYHPLSASNYVITFQFLQRYLDHCINKNAIIHCIIPYPQTMSIIDDLIILYGLRSAPHAASSSSITVLSDLKVTNNFLDFGNAECSVCMEDFKIEEVTTQLPCKHVHHKECIARWQQIHNSCPICRDSGTSNPQSMVSSIVTREEMTDDRKSNFMVQKFSIVMQRLVDLEVELTESGRDENDALRQGTKLVLS